MVIGSAARLLPVLLAVTVIAVLLLFAPPVSYAAIAAAGLADPVAGLVGPLRPVAKLPYNRKKSVGGTAAGLVAAVLAVSSASVFLGARWYFQEEIRRSQEKQLESLALVAQAAPAAVEADPPERYTFRIDRPLEQPPNWLTYLLHSVLAIAFYSVFAALLGHLSGKLTTGLSPPNRRNARWAPASGSARAGPTLPVRCPCSRPVPSMPRGSHRKAPPGRSRWR